jgi:hypothetical protein
MKSLSASRLWIVALVVVFVAGGMAAHADSAWAWGKRNKEPVDPRGKAVNMNLSPETVITRGILQMDGFGSWTLDGQTLAFDKDSRIGDNDEDPAAKQLQAGYEAMVIGSPLGNALLVHRVTMIPADESMKRGMLNPKKSTEMPKEMTGRVPQ